MINYFNFKPFGDGYLLTNDFGNYAFVDAGTLRAYLAGELTEDVPAYDELRRKGFVVTGSSLDFSDQWRWRYQGAKQYLTKPTSLHIIVVSTRCSMACRYCQAGCGGEAAGDLMTPEEARRVAEAALSTPAESVTFEFQGGEPLTNFAAVQAAVEHAEELKGDRQVRYSIVSNLTLLDEQMVEFFVRHHFDVSTSIDGPEVLHGKNRPLKGGQNSYEATVRGMELLRQHGLQVGAVLTVTRDALAQPEAVVDAYRALGLHSIALRPLTPLGAALDHWDELGYTPEEFASFYSRALERVLAVNREDYRLRENTAGLVCAKALHGYGVNHMEYRSPCGAAVGQLAYYPGGDVYTCDEGRMLHDMGDDSFCLGNIYADRYQDLIGCSKCRAVCLASVLESAPGCCDCAYQPYCGVCPVVNLALYGDLQSKEPHAYQCAIREQVFDKIFTVLKNADAETMGTLRSWDV